MEGRVRQASEICPEDLEPGEEHRCGGCVEHKGKKFSKYLSEVNMRFCDGRADAAAEIGGVRFLEGQQFHVHFLPPSEARACLCAR